MTVKAFPQVRRAATGKVDFSKEREWLLHHGQEYINQWVVLGEGHLVGHTADGNEVAAIIARARAQGICFPYVKFVDDESKTVWMGWL